jgi:C-terminal processing protease CtpA/Prc
MPWSNQIRSGVALLLLFVAPPLLSGTDKDSLSKSDRELARTMLEAVKRDIRDHYFDPSFHGVDMDGRFRAADQAIQQAGSFREAVGAIESALQGLNDSHTHFTPPAQPFRVEYGYRISLVGDSCYIVQVKPGSDAEAKRVMIGDLVESLDGASITRDSFWSLEHSMNVLAPRTVTTLVLRSPNGVERSVQVQTAVKQLRAETNLSGAGAGMFDVNELVRRRNDLRHYMRPRYVELGDELMVLKLPNFYYSEDQIDRMIGHARRHKSLIVDLRGNPGGAALTDKWLMGGVFSHDVKVADRVARSGTKKEVANSKGGGAFTGNLIVLVDHGSLSASEVFARVVQLENRGTVVGDRTGGMVMESTLFPHSMGSSGAATYYGANITVADLIMTDGKSIEQIGVRPDTYVLPSQSDLASGRDLALTVAAHMVGVDLDPQVAGKLFPFEWPPQ